MVIKPFVHADYWIYTQNLGNVFSKMAIWILLGTEISIYSGSKKKAMINVFPFCIGMLVTYYFVEMITDDVYFRMTIPRWRIFALCSPIFAHFTRMTKKKALFQGGDPCRCYFRISAVRYCFLWRAERL